MFCTFSVLGWHKKLGILVLLGSIWLFVFCISILDFATLFEFFIIFLFLESGKIIVVFLCVECHFETIWYIELVWEFEINKSFSNYFIFPFVFLNF